MPNLPRIRNVRHLARDIAQFCPKLKRLVQLERNWEVVEVRQLLIGVLEALPPQQVQEFMDGKGRPFTIPDLDNVGSCFRRHSTTLRKIILHDCADFNSTMIQIILVECPILEHFNIDWTTNRNEHQLCIKLEDAVELPWACTRIRDLGVTIAIPDQPLYHLADGVEPYNKRPAPIELSAEETRQFELLETLYRQIGALKDLTSLSLQAIFFDPQGHRPMSKDPRHNSFPGLLSLGSQKTGRPGYLHHLGRLTKLKCLRGSVSAMTEETKETVGIQETSWMEHHWPELVNAEFFTNESEPLSLPFLWLQQQRGGEHKLELFRPSYIC
ncbi:hypothetical protein BGZ97_012556 [Linnemannia gamsii]|uniref:Uncharacterized protein n=1 Tax=Linnemannia gamsii TaxID=64522 RepID=A0A9P6R0Z1_9FUNG|nr:hypothetical protein BGZ97_012556 [Linnemannia gamsii]